MRSIVAFILFIPMAFFLGGALVDEFREKPEHLKSELEIVKDLLEDITFNTPKRIKILHNEGYMDKKTREKFKIIVFKTDEEYLPKSPKNPAIFDDVLRGLKDELPEYNFGKSSGNKANYSHFLIGNAEWTVSWLQTDRGYFSKWIRRIDVHQLIREE